MDTFEKLDASTLKKVSTVENISTYDYDFLLNQKTSIQASLDEVNALIAQADSLGIKPKVEASDGL